MHVNTERAELQLNGSARSAHQMNAAAAAQFILRRAVHHDLSLH